MKQSWGKMRIVRLLRSARNNRERKAGNGRERVA